MNTAGLERNLKLYPWYQAASGFLAWLPIFFLFFFQYVTLSEALKISAFYYFGVFLLEVPSGYFSDRLGRRPTLLLSCGLAVLGYGIIIANSTCIGFAIGQLFIAGYFSFKSGSDNSLLFDSLSALGRESEYAQREATATRFSMLSMAAAALLGGLTGVVNLVIPYYLSAFGAIVAMTLCYRFTEPETHESAAPFFKQIGICISRLKQKQLLWCFVFFVLLYSLEHVPAEFNQAYVSLLSFKWFGFDDSSALVSGVMVAISMLSGAFGATVSIRVLERYGARKLLLSALAIMLLIIAGMASMLHEAILLLVLFRNFSMAFSNAPLLAVISPHLQSSYRATYLSLQSLAGRLGFSIMLYSLSKLVDSTDQAQTVSWPELQTALAAGLAIGVIGFILLWVFRIEERDEASAS